MTGHAEIIRPVSSYVTCKTKRRFDLPQVSKFDAAQRSSIASWEIAVLHEGLALDI